MAVTRPFSAKNYTSDDFRLTLTTPQIRTSEDLLTLSRQLKELWLFGGLREVRATTSGITQEVGAKRARRADEDARAIVAAVSGLLTAGG